jgi:hypothetical protein
MVFVTITLVAYMGSFMNQLFWASTVSGKKPYDSPFTTLREMVDPELNHGYTYGCVNQSSTYKYITEVAPGPLFEKMTKYFNDNPAALVKSTKEGLDRANNESYAFMMETTSLRYAVNSNPCTLMDTGVTFGMKSYGLAVGRTSPIKESLHQAILEMIENGEIEGLENKWFDNGECAHVQMAEDMIKQLSTLYLNQPARLSLHTFYSHILIMILGFVAAIIVAIVEIIWFKYKGRYDAANRPRGHQLAEDDGHI